MRFIKALITLLLFLLGLLFFTQNEAALTTPLVLKYDLYLEGWAWSGLNVPFYFVLLVAFAAGSLLAVFFFFMDKMRANFQLIGSKKIARTLEKEITRLTSENETLKTKVTDFEKGSTGSSGTSDRKIITAE